MVTVRISSSRTHSFKAILILSLGLFSFHFFLSGSLHAQPTKTPHPLTFYHNRFALGVHPENGNFLIFTNSAYYELNDKTNSWSRYRYKRNQLDSAELRVGNLLYVPTATHSYYLLNGGGSVYEFKDSSLLRIDHSFPHRNQHGGAFFSTGGKIYLYGGYGFFQHKDYLTEFSFQNPQWFIYGYDPKSTIPAPRNNMLYHFNEKENALYVGEGRANQHPALNGSQSTPNKDVWVLHLKSRKWKKLGWISSASYPRDHSDPISIGEKSYFLNLGQAKLLYAVDLKNNTISGYSASNNQNHRINGHIVPVYSARINKVLFIYKHSDMGLNEQVHIPQAISLEALEANEVFTQRFYYPRSWATLGILLILSIVCVTLLIIGRKFIRDFIRWPRHKPVESPELVLHIKSRSMYHMDRLIPFQAEHLDLIISFWQNGWGLPNLKLLDVVRAGQESQEALKKRKSRVIEEVNQLFAFTTHTYEPFILEVKDQNDRRYKEYLINPVYLGSIQVVE